MNHSFHLWIGLTLLFVFLELMTKTFSMLMLSIGFGMAALFAWMGFGFMWSAVIAGGVGAAGFAWLKHSRVAQDLQEAQESRYSVMDDDGDEVYISRWGEANQAQVTYRGRTWHAELAKGRTPMEGRYRVREVREGRLILD